MLVLWFCTSVCFQFWSKTFMKHCSNNSLLSRDRSISSLLDLIGHVLLISENVLEKQLLLILMKNLHRELHKELCTIMCQKTFFPCILWFVRCFQFQGIIWKTEHDGDNLNFDFVPLLFILLTLNPFYFAFCLCCSCQLF